MSRFFNKDLKNLKAYVPGEQPKEIYIKLNTNESPYPPSGRAIIEAKKQVRNLNRYSDPTQMTLRKEMAKLKGVAPENIMFTNGSDEALSFIFYGFCEEGIQFPDITYGLYQVIANLYGVDYNLIPLRDDYRINVEDYSEKKPVIIANPNAPTGISLCEKEIKKLVEANPQRLVIIDEAYQGFGSYDAASLIKEYDNLLLTGTFSKGFGFAGGRLGWVIADKDIISDLEKIRYSINPYNVNSMTEAFGIGILKDIKTVKANCKTIEKTRENVVEELKKQGFEILPSDGNFVFAKNPEIPGKVLYERLREKGILVRYFAGERTKDYIRITIGTPIEMNALIKASAEILGHKVTEIPVTVNSVVENRSWEMERNTLETQVRVYASIDGTGESQVDTGIGFLDHMLILFAKYSNIDLVVKAVGDYEVDYHHTAEDIGITMGKVLRKALGEKLGIQRYGQSILPMDEALVVTALDFSGRFNLNYDVKFKTEKTGDFDNELIKEFWKAFAENMAASVHIKMIEGENSHHISEAIFKSMGKTFRQAASYDEKNIGKVISSKGVLA